MPKKPVKWGYKMWCRAGISGYIYDFEVRGGLGVKGPPTNLPKPEEYGESEFLVMRLTKDLDPGKHQVFFDNLFSSPDLLVYLSSQQVYSIATLRSDRSRGCKLPSDKDLRKGGRGNMAQFVDSGNGLVICAWYDNRRVLTISNLGKYPIGEGKRCDKVGKETINISHPASVELYNKFMGGVDKADMYLALYRSKVRTRKWYHRIAFHLMSLAVINAFVVYREIGGHGSLLQFITDTCRSLLASDSVPQRDALNEPPIAKRCRSLKANDVPDNICLDKINHWPLQCDEPQRCKNPECGRRTRFICSKCQVFLCVTGTKCFLDFHGIQTE